MLRERGQNAASRPIAKQFLRGSSASLLEGEGFSLAGESGVTLDRGEAEGLDGRAT